MSERYQGKFAASTLAATAWVITYTPERLQEWLDRHPDGAALERETRALIAAKAARQRADASAVQR